MIEAGSLSIVGDGELLTIKVLRGSMESVLEDLSNSPPGNVDGADSHEAQLIDTVLEREQLIDLIVGYMIMLLEPFRVDGSDGRSGTDDDGGWVVADSCDAGKCVAFTDFVTDPETAAKTDNYSLSVIGRASLVDNGQNDGIVHLSVAAEQNRHSRAELTFRLSEVLNETQSASIRIFVDRYFRFYNDAHLTAGNPPLESPQPAFDADQNHFMLFLGETFAHEIGHAIGLFHTGKRGIDIGLSNARDDIMFQGVNPNAPKTLWPITENTWKVALGLDYGAADVGQVFEYFEHYYDTVEAHKRPDGGSDFGQTTGAGDFDLGAPRQLDDGALQIVPADNPTYVSEIDFGTVAVDATGFELTQVEFVLRNIGDQDLAIHDVAIDGGQGGFRWDAPNILGTSLEPYESLPLTITFDPTVGGQHTAELVVRNDGLGGIYRITLHGYGQSPDGDLVVDVANNNLGGAIVGDLPVRVEEGLSITNQGAQPAGDLRDRGQSGQRRVWCGRFAGSYRFCQSAGSPAARIVRT